MRQRNRPSGALLASLAFLLAVAPSLAAAPERPPTPRIGPVEQHPLAGGMLLVATPRLASPVFAKTVVLLLDYGANGALGVILNRPTSLALSDMFPNVEKLKQRSDPVYLGGPVSPSSMAFLIRGDPKPPESQRLMADVHMSGSALALEHAVERELPEDRFHAYVGYAGWAPQQLDGEVARGDWWVVPAAPQLIFETPHERLWEELVRQHGGVHVRRDDPARLPRAG